MQNHSCLQIGGQGDRETLFVQFPAFCGFQFLYIVLAVGIAAGEDKFPVGIREVDGCGKDP